MSKELIIAPSLLAADFGRLGEEIQAVETAGADWLHVDVMDGHFVPPITFGTNMLHTCKQTSKLPLDVHLMVDAPERHVPEFISAGAHVVTFHIEATAHAHRLLQFIRSGGAQAGISLNPATPSSSVLPVLELCDLVLVMTVNPGWGGQTFIDSCLAKVEELANEASKRNLDLHIEVDGGINAETSKLCRNAGANVFVAGSFIFGSSNVKQAIDLLRS